MQNGTWALTGLLTLGVLINPASPSGWERLLRAPLAAVLATLSVIVARSRPHTQNPGKTRDDVSRSCFARPEPH